MKKKVQEECPICEEYIEVINDLQQKLLSLQSLTSRLTKAELLLDKHGLLEQIDTISNTEAICVEQLQRLKDKSAVMPLTESDIKVLDILHKNLRIVRGAKDTEDNKNTKKLSEVELIQFLKSS